MQNKGKKHIHFVVYGSLVKYKLIIVCKKFGIVCTNLEKVSDSRQQAFSAALKCHARSQPEYGVYCRKVSRDWSHISEKKYLVCNLHMQLYIFVSTLARYCHKQPSINAFPWNYKFQNFPPYKSNEFGHRFVWTSGKHGPKAQRQLNRLFYSN